MVKGRHVGKKLVHVGIVDLFLPPGGFCHILNQLSGSVPQGSGAVEHRRGEGIVRMGKQKLGSLDFHVIIIIIVLTGPGQIVLILFGFPRGSGNRHIPFRLRIGRLYPVGKQVLGKKPGRQDLLGILLIKDTDGRPLGNHLRIRGIKLRNHHHLGFKIHQGFFTDIGKRRIGPHPGSARSGVYGKNALPGI